MVTKSYKKLQKFKIFQLKIKFAPKKSWYKNCIEEKKLCQNCIILNINKIKSIIVPVTEIQKISAKIDWQAGRKKNH